MQFGKKSAPKKPIVQSNQKIRSTLSTRAKNQEGWKTLVKLQRRTAKKPYLNNKRIYHYEREHVTIIKKYHLTSKPFREQDLDEQVWVENGSLMIKLTPKKPSDFKWIIAVATFFFTARTF